MNEPTAGDRDIDAAGFVDREARAEYRRIALSIFLVAFMNAHSTLLSIVFAHDGYDLHTIGVLLSSMAITVILFALLSGEFSGRLGVLPTLRIAMALTLVGFASLMATRGVFAAALASRLVQGAGQGLFLSAAITYAQSRLSSARFLFLLGVFSAMMPLAQAVAPPFGEWVLNVAGDRAMFLAASAPALVGLALTLGVRPVPKPPSSGGLHLVASWRPSLIEPMLAILVGGAMFGFTTAYMAAALQARSVPLAAFFTASTLTMFATRALGLRRIETANRRYLVGAGLAFEAIGFLVVAAAQRFWLVALGGVLFGVGHSMVYPVLSVWISEGVAPERRAGPQAWLNTFFNIGLFAAPLPETWLIYRLGYEQTMSALAGLAAFGAVWLAARGATVAR